MQYILSNTQGSQSSRFRFATFVKFGSEGANDEQRYPRKPGFSDLKETGISQSSGRRIFLHINIVKQNSIVSDYSINIYLLAFVNTENITRYPYLLRKF